MQKGEKLKSFLNNSSHWFSSLHQYFMGLNLLNFHLPTYLEMTVVGNMLNFHHDESKTKEN